MEKYNYLEIAKRKGFPQWVIEKLMEKGVFKEIVVRGYKAERINEDEELKLITGSGSGSKFYFNSFYEVMDGEIEIVNEEYENWRTGGAYLNKTIVTVKPKKNTIIRYYYYYDAQGVEKKIIYYCE